MLTTKRETSIMKTGAAMISESRVSSIPPLPGMMTPLSLTPAALLKVDSIRSPVQENIEVAKPRSTPWIGENRNRSLKIIGASAPIRQGTAIPPINPATDLLGLTLNIPLLFFPNAMPKKYAKESVQNTNAK